MTSPIFRRARGNTASGNISEVSAPGVRSSQLDVARHLWCDRFEFLIGDLDDLAIGGLVPADQIVFIELLTFLRAVISASQRMAGLSTEFIAVSRGRMAERRSTGMLTRPNVIVPDQMGRTAGALFSRSAAASAARLVVA